MAQCAKNNRQQALVGLTGLCGLRVSEALSVRPSNIDFNSMLLTVRGKGDKTRVVPISPDAWLLLCRATVEALPSNREIVSYKDRFARSILTDLAKRAQLRRHVASHDMRATFATEGHNKMPNLRVIQELLGHSSSSNTEVYTGVSVDQMREAADF
jgi:site-specific recombinase XerD